MPPVKRRPRMRNEPIVVEIEDTERVCNDVSPSGMQTCELLVLGHPEREHRRAAEDGGYYYWPVQTQ